MIVNIILAGLIVFLGIAAAAERRRGNRWKDQCEKAVQAGLELQRNAITNDKALRQGLDDQMEIYENEMIEDKEKIALLEKQLSASRSNLGRLLARISELQTAHAMHSDHCLPVLEEMSETARPTPEEAVVDIFDRLQREMSGETETGYIKGL